MLEFKKKVKKELKKASETEADKSKEHPNQYYPFTIHFGDRYNGMSDRYTSLEVCYLLKKFPPCKMYKHEGGGTGYYPTNVIRKEKRVKVQTATEVNPVRLDCDGLDTYIYTLKWFTKINDNFFKLEVIINYGTELVNISYKYNDSRNLPKFSGFKAEPRKAGLKPIMYYGDSGEYMTKYKCEVIDINDKDFFI